MGKIAIPGNEVYTYRNGKKVYLKKERDQFVVRSRPDELVRRGRAIEDLEVVSPSSVRVTIHDRDLDEAMEAERENNVTHHAYTRTDNDTEFLVTDRILVTFREPVTPEQINEFMARYALLLKAQYSEKDFLLQLTNATGMNPLKLVVQINEHDQGLIEACEHDLNKRVRKSDINLPSDTKYNKQWHLHTRVTHNAFDHRSSSRCEDAWISLNHFGNSDVVIGVTDDGCKIDHADFDSSGKFAHWGYMSGLSLINRDSVSADGTKMYEIGADHGTNCCGVVGAEIDGALTVGAAPGCKLLPIKWQSTASGGLAISDGKMMTMLNFVADKVDVLSNSWASIPESVWSTQVVNKIKQLALNGGRRGKGIVFLWAAGNENCPIQYSGDLDVPYDHGYDDNEQWVGVSTSNLFENNLVGIPGVMHIAALASTAQRSHYSNYGEGISLSAPSSNSHEYWRLTLPGLAILTTSGASPFFDPDFGGTSSATPLVAGICGLVISANPQLSALEVVSILQQTAGKDLKLSAWSKTPAAPFDPDPSWDISPVTPFDNGDFIEINHPDGKWSPWFGFGVVNAKAAVEKAMQMGVSTTDAVNTITKTSSPAKSIPDNKPAGINDVMTINDAGTISGVKVDLDITHTYIGDLMIKLISPRGTPAILHDRNGGSTKNIQKSYDVQNAPHLSRFPGEPVSGNWTLKVADVAPADTGKLNKWTIHVNTGMVQEINVEESPGLAIPDNNPGGIERSLNVIDNGNVKEVAIGIDVTHSFINDLIINLVSPSGTVVSLHSKTGGSADNIIKTYTFANHMALQSLLGQPIQGNWKLRISDVEGQDVGKLNKWSVRIVKQ